MYVLCKMHHCRRTASLNNIKEIAIQIYKIKVIRLEFALYFSRVSPAMIDTTIYFTIIITYALNYINTIRNIRVYEPDIRRVASVH